MLFCIAQPVAKGAHDMTIAPPIAAVRALFFDVFGTLVDFRTSVAREAEPALHPRRLSPGLTPASPMPGGPNISRPWKRCGSAGSPYVKLDVLHRKDTQSAEFLPRFGVPALPEETMRELTLAWHRLDAWPEVPAAIGAAEKEIPAGAAVERQHLADGRSRASQ